MPGTGTAASNRKTMSRPRTTRIRRRMIRRPEGVQQRFEHGVRRRRRTSVGVASSEARVRQRRLGVGGARRPAARSAVSRRLAGSAATARRRSRLGGGASVGASASAAAASVGGGSSVGLGVEADGLERRGRDLEDADRRRRRPRSSMRADAVNASATTNSGDVSSPLPRILSGLFRLRTSPTARSMSWLTVIWASALAPCPCPSARRPGPRTRRARRRPRWRRRSRPRTRS